MIDLLAVLLSILVGLVQWHNSPEKKKERNSDERDREIADKDHIAKSKRLSDLVDSV